MMMDDDEDDDDGDDDDDDDDDDDSVLTWVHSVKSNRWSQKQWATFVGQFLFRWLIWVGAIPPQKAIFVFSCLDPFRTAESRCGDKILGIGLRLSFLYSAAVNM